MVNKRRNGSKEKEQGEPMRKKKRYAQAVKRIMRPELTHCLECQSKLQRCVTISDRMIITLTQVIRLVHCGYRCPHPECGGTKNALSEYRGRCFGKSRGLRLDWIWSCSSDSNDSESIKPSMKFTSPSWSS